MTIPSWPAWVIIGTLAVNLVVHISHDGRARSPYNAIGALFSVAIEVFLLHHGNFFAAIGWPA